MIYQRIEKPSLLAKIIGGSILALVIGTIYTVIGLGLSYILTVMFKTYIPIEVSIILVYLAEHFTNKHFITRS